MSSRGDPCLGTSWGADSGVAMTGVTGMERRKENNIVSVEEETAVRTPTIMGSISEVSTTGGSLSVKGSDRKGESE